MQYLKRSRLAVLQKEFRQHYFLRKGFYKNTTSSIAFMPTSVFISSITLVFAITNWCLSGADERRTNNFPLRKKISWVFMAIALPIIFSQLSTIVTSFNFP